MSTNAKTGMLAAALAAVAILAAFLKRSDVYLLTLCCVYLMATFGLNLIVGYAGQMSIGQAAFFGIGAYIAGLLMTKMGISFWAVLPLRGADLLRRRTRARLPGLARPAPLPRVRDARLQRAGLPGHAQRGEADRRHVRRGQHSAADRCSAISLDGALPFFYLSYVSVILLAGALWWLLRSPWGRAFAALRDNPIRAESTGVNITAYTLLAFAIGAACAGVGGVYFAALVNFIEPGQFHLSVSLMMLLAVIVGGSGRFFGPVLGTVVVILLPELLRFMQNWYLAIFGFAIIVMMVFLPGGLLSISDRFGSKGAAK